MRRLAQDHEIAQLETARGIKLPDEYVQFLKASNGGVCRHDKIITLENGIEVLADLLLGFNDREAFSLVYWNEKRDEDLGQGVVMIGHDPGGGIYILIEQDGGCGLHYYDSFHRFPGSSEESNTYACDLSLAEFLSLVDRPLSA